jgi:3-oxoacyl-[acyl-carrier-protein] synthase II
MKRVVVTGMAGISPLGTGWEETAQNLKGLRNAVVRMPGWDEYRGMNTQLAAPIPKFELPPDRYSRKATRGMGRVSLLAVRATDLALEDAGLSGHPIVQTVHTGIAYGSSSGSQDAIGDVGTMLTEKSTHAINATTYIRMMSHTAAVNIGLFFQAKGRIITTCSACASGSQGIGYAYEAIKFGRQTVMLAGGSEELHPTQAAVFDTLFATSTRNDAPETTPRPFDARRDGLVIGEGAATLVLEELEHAVARGARIHAEVVGYGTNSDGWHVTNPNKDTMCQAMSLALQDAGVHPDEVGYVNAHGTGTDNGDVAESHATHAVFGARAPISSLKSYMGHTLGACGALEAWISVMMMRDGWVAPTLNLETVDVRCAPLDYVRGDVRALETDLVMSNNFAFGGINTSLLFRRWEG